LALPVWSKFTRCILTEQLSQLLERGQQTRCQPQIESALFVVAGLRKRSSIEFALAGNFGAAFAEWRSKGGPAMPRGDKGKYTDKQKRKAEHIEEGYEDRGVSKKEAESRAWATVNKESGGGKKSGSGRGKKESDASSKKGGKKGGKKAGKKSSKKKSSKKSKK
jgi:plasmid stabilization system protein ParE